MDREAWWVTTHGVARVGRNLASKPPPLLACAKAFLLDKRFWSVQSQASLLFPPSWLDLEKRRWLIKLSVSCPHLTHLCPLFCMGARVFPESWVSFCSCTNVTWTLTCDYLGLCLHPSCGWWVNFVQFVGLLRRLIWLSLSATLLPATLSTS